MSVPDEIKKQLPSFFSVDEPTAEPLGADDVAKNEELAKEPGGAADLKKCARVDAEMFGKSCGFAGSGSKIYVFNARNDRAVRATVRVDWGPWGGQPPGSKDKVFTVPAGSKVYAGCTKGDHATTAIEFKYTLVGCTIL